MGSNLLLFNRFIHERQRRFHFCTGSPRFFYRFSLVPKGKCFVTSDDFQFPPLEEISETLPLWGPFVTLLFYLGLTLKAAFPAGSKRAALLLGVHFILLHFIWISPFAPKTFVLLLWWIVGGVQLFWSLNLLIVIWYIPQVQIYMSRYANLCSNFFLWVLYVSEVKSLTPRKPKS